MLKKPLSLRTIYLRVSVQNVDLKNPYDCFNASTNVRSAKPNLRNVLEKFEFELLSGLGGSDLQGGPIRRSEDPRKSRGGEGGAS